jgi:hypothetical protein
VSQERVVRRGVKENWVTDDLLLSGDEMRDEEEVQAKEDEGRLWAGAINPHLSPALRDSMRRTVERLRETEKKLAFAEASAKTSPRLEIFSLAPKAIVSLSFPPEQHIFADKNKAIEFTREQQEDRKPTAQFFDITKFVYHG